LARTLARDTFVGAIALHDDTLWITVSRKLHDDETPADHVALLAIRASDGRVLAQSPIPGTGKDGSEPQLVEGDNNQIWVWLADQMERIVTGPC
jgi:hypothetical protein